MNYNTSKNKLTNTEIENLIINLEVQSLKNNLKNKKCFYKDCNNTNVIYSHTISKALLKSISFNDKVYTWLPNSITKKLYKHDKTNLKLEEATINPGKNGATCFQGFCKKHDTNLFKNIEVEQYVEKVTNEEYAFLYSYRNLIHNLWIEKALGDKKYTKINGTLNSQKNNIDLIRRNLNSILNLNSKIESLTKLKEIYENYILGNGDIKSFSSEFFVYVEELKGVNIQFAGITTTQMNLINTKSCYPISVGILPKYKDKPNMFFIVSHRDDKKLFELFKAIAKESRYFKENLMLYENQNLVLEPELFNNLKNDGELQSLYNKFINKFNCLDLSQFLGFDLFK